MRPVFNFLILAALSIWFFFHPSPVNGQDTIYQSSVSYSAGYSLPYSLFAEKTFARMAGFSSGGPVIDFRYQHFYGKQRIFGLFADASFTSHFFNEKSYTSAYEQRLDIEGDLQITAGNYMFAVTRVGILLSLPEFAGTRIILDAGLGAAFCYHPELSVYNTYWGQINTVPPDLDAKIMSAAGVSVEHSINRSTAILLSWSAHGFTPSFRDDVGEHTIYFDLPVRYMNFTLGISRYF